MFSSLFALNYFIGPAYVFYVSFVMQPKNVLSLGYARLILLIIHLEFLTCYVQIVEYADGMLLMLGHNFKLLRECSRT